MTLYTLRYHSTIMREGLGHSYYNMVDGEREKSCHGNVIKIYLYVINLKVPTTISTDNLLT